MILDKMKLLFAVSGLLVLLDRLEGKAILTNNQFTEFVVAISPDVAQDDAIIPGIQSMMRDMSREMYKATRNRAYIKTVKILVPKTWTVPDAVDIENESFETSDFRIDIPNPCYGDSPYTLQTTECGVPGTYTHLTTGYVIDGGQYGNKGKTLVHEFAKLRWGVFEEHGYPGDAKFPMYYMKAVWSPSGQVATVTPNFCVNGELRGYEQDRSDGGACKPDDEGSGLPDGNCVFYATQESAVTSSYMALPYLASNLNFCDDTEELYHDTQLPNKQNLYCDGRSTWNVIESSPDFANGANPAKPGVTNTDPDFIVVGGAGETSAMPYVLVVDISLSMKEKERFVPMQNAAKRWISYDLQDGVSLGMVYFNDNSYIGFNMTAVGETTKEFMAEKIDGLTASGQTCIYCALYDAAKKPGLLNNSSGVIILLTDGKQNVGPALKGIIPILVQQNIRVVTIALGSEADEEIEDIAEQTGGKSFYVDDNGGPGDFNDAFSGSTTYQPGDTLGDTEVTIYQKDWPKGNENSFRDTFEVDSTLGRELSFRLEFVKDKSAVVECDKHLNISFTDANAGRTNEQFKCSKDNFGIYTKLFDLNAPSGKWLYQIDVSEESFVSLSVKITSKAKNNTQDPITTKCWINTGSQIIGEEVQLKLSAMAEVKQGNMPVIGATVKAYIERPQESGEPLPALELELMDNGAGADTIQNDGIYTRYFTKYTGDGRYSVKCEVSGGDDTQVNEGFIVSRDSNGKQRNKRSIPMEPIPTPMCCGSNTVRPDSVLKSTGNFTRMSAGGSFKAKNVPTGDVYPPSKVTDLKVPNQEGDLVIEFTSPGDDLDSVEPVASYTLKYALTSGNLTQNFDSPNNNNSTVEIDDSFLAEGSLNPVPGGTKISLKLDPSKLQAGKLHFFAIKATDEAGNSSPVSNVVSYCLDCEVTNPTTMPSGAPAKVAAGSVMVTVLFVIAVMF